MVNEADKDKEAELTRAFICIEVPDSVIKEVARVQGILGKKVFTGKMTELENLHLTLKFLGEINDVKLDEVRRKLSEIKIKGFDARVSEIGAFSHRGNPRIVWVKIGGGGIFELQEKIDKLMVMAGFKKEERFMSHMTIARVGYVKDKKDFIRYVRNIGIKEINFKVDKFKLMKSELNEKGPDYSLIEEYGYR